MTDIEPNRLVFSLTSMLSWNTLSFYDLFRPQTWTLHLLTSVSSFLVLLLLPTFLCHKSHNFSQSHSEISREMSLVSIFHLRTLSIILFPLYSLMHLLPSSFLSKSGAANTSFFVNCSFNFLNALSCLSVYSHFWFFFTILYNGLAMDIKSLMN